MLRRSLLESRDRNARTVSVPCLAKSQLLGSKLMSISTVDCGIGGNELPFLHRFLGGQRQHLLPLTVFASVTLPSGATVTETRTSPPTCIRLASSG